MEQFKFRPGVEVGSLSAEDDELLIQAFVKKIEYEELRKINTHKSLLIGRTGAGKSAVLKYIEEQEENVKRINPEAMSLRFLSNSTILNYFKNLDINLDLFYKLLWKHVFIVELLKMYFGDKPFKEKNWFEQQFYALTTSKSKKRAIEYLRTWENEFWAKTEYRVKEIEKGLKNEYAKQIGVSVEALELKMQNSQILEETERSEIINKAQKVVSEVQIEEILTVIEVMKEDLFNDEQKKYYIIIDDLDKDWVDKSLVNDLIKGLILAVYDLRIFKGVKIIISLQSNLLALTLNQSSSHGIQREKYQGMTINIHWTKDELKELLEKRFALIMKHAYTSKGPSVDDVFPPASKGKISGFDFIIERTFLRPRDVIDFTNKCFEKAAGSTKINRETIRKAELEYSSNRFNAVCDEWYDNYGSIAPISSILKNKAEPIKVSDITETDLFRFLEKIHLNTYSDEIKSFIKQFEDDLDVDQITKKIFVILYRVGIIGVKRKPDEEIQYSYQNAMPLQANEIDEQSKFYIHKAFSRYFNS